MMRGSKGLSAVELAVTVSIAGILAAVAIPSFTRYIAKSKQTEAKANLLALYSAEKSFFFNQQFYCPRLDAIGFKPTGQLTYRIGFSSDSAGTPVGVGTANCISTASVACPVITWQESPSATGAGAIAVGNIVATPTPSSFNAEARGALGGNAVDIWQINNTNSNPVNTQSGL